MDTMAGISAHNGDDSDDGDRNGDLSAFQRSRNFYETVRQDGDDELMLSYDLLTEAPHATLRDGVTVYTGGDIIVSPDSEPKGFFQMFLELPGFRGLVDAMLFRNGRFALFDSRDQPFLMGGHFNDDDDDDDDHSDTTDDDSDSDDDSDEGASYE
jgi:hypothetical protein